MSRFDVWVLCCAVVLITLAFTGAFTSPDVNIRALLSMLASLGAPLVIHWAFSSETPTKDVKDV